MFLFVIYVYIIKVCSEVDMIDSITIDERLQTGNLTAQDQRMDVVRSCLKQNIVIIHQLDVANEINVSFRAALTLVRVHRL